MGGGIPGFFANLLQFFNGGTGRTIIIVAISLSAVLAAYEIVRWKRVGETIFAGVILFAAGWIATNWIGA